MRTVINYISHYSKQVQTFRKTDRQTNREREDERERERGRTKKTDKQAYKMYLSSVVEISEIDYERHKNI